MDSAFKGTIYEPYDMLTEHTHALVIHVNPDISESPILQGRKRTKDEMREFADAVFSMIKEALPLEIYTQRLPVEGFLVIALGVDFSAFNSEERENIFLDDLYLRMETVQMETAQTLQMTLELSISSLHPHNQNVFDAYQEALSIAVHRPFFQNKRNIILHRDFQRGLSPSAAETKRNLEKQWLSLMEAKNYRDAEPILLEIVDLRASAPQTATSLTQELISRLEFYIYQLCDPIELPSGSQEMLLKQVDLIRGAKTLEELHQQLHGIFTAMEQIDALGNKPNDLSWSRRISTYIQSNYVNPTLNAELISRQFGLHPAYISHVFHKSTGVKLLDYIHITRIEHIKQLLKRTDMSLTDIAHKTGYYDRYSMSRVFSRYVGIPPSEYRRN